MVGIKGKAHITAVHEHATRKAKDESVSQIHAEKPNDVLADAGLRMDHVDGYFSAIRSPSLGSP